MVAFVDMDEKVSLQAQLEDAAGPVVLINKFTVKADEAEQLVRAWADDAAWMKRQPGNLSYGINDCKRK
jgi:hypothetical protein